MSALCVERRLDRRLVDAGCRPRREGSRLAVGLGDRAVCLEVRSNGRLLLEFCVFGSFAEEKSIACE